jgi:hypothetical protein
MEDDLLTKLFIGELKNMNEVKLRELIEQEEAKKGEQNWIDILK